MSLIVRANLLCPVLSERGDMFFIQNAPPVSQRLISSSDGRSLSVSKEASLCWLTATFSTWITFHIRYTCFDPCHILSIIYSVVAVDFRLNYSHMQHVQSCGFRYRNQTVFLFLKKRHRSLFFLLIEHLSTEVFQHRSIWLKRLLCSKKPARRFINTISPW